MPTRREYRQQHGQSQGGQVGGHRLPEVRSAIYGAAATEMCGHCREEGITAWFFVGNTPDMAPGTSGKRSSLLAIR